MDVPSSLIAEYVRQVSHKDESSTDYAYIRDLAKDNEETDVLRAALQTILGHPEWKELPRDPADRPILIDSELRVRLTRLLKELSTAGGASLPEVTFTTGRLKEWRIARMTYPLEDPFKRFLFSAFNVESFGGGWKSGVHASLETTPGWNDLFLKQWARFIRERGLGPGVYEAITNHHFARRDYIYDFHKEQWLIYYGVPFVDSFETPPPIKDFGLKVYPDLNGCIDYLMLDEEKWKEGETALHAVLTSFREEYKPNTQAIRRDIDRLLETLPNITEEQYKTIFDPYYMPPRGNLDIPGWLRRIAELLR